MGIEHYQFYEYPASLNTNKGIKSLETSLSDISNFVNESKREMDELKTALMDSGIGNL